MAVEVKSRFDRLAERLELKAFGMIYGSITVLATVLAFGHSAEDPVRTALILFGSVLAMTLAKAFAQVSSDAVRDRRRPGRADFRQAWHHTAPTLAAANVPALMIAGAATGLYDIHRALVLSQLYAIVVLVLFGYSIGWVIYRRVWPAALNGAFTGAIGLALALLKYVMH